MLLITVVAELAEGSGAARDEVFAVTLRATSFTKQASVPRRDRPPCGGQHVIHIMAAMSRFMFTRWEQRHEVHVGTCTGNAALCAVKVSAKGGTGGCQRCSPVGGVVGVGCGGGVVGVGGRQVAMDIRCGGVSAGGKILCKVPYDRIRVRVVCPPPSTTATTTASIARPQMGRRGVWGKNGPIRVTRIQRVWNPRAEGILR